jgi:hypothetical protein
MRPSPPDSPTALEAGPFREPERFAIRMAVPLMALLAMAAFAAVELDPAGAAESAFLALWAAAALVAVGFLAPRPALELGAGATLAVLAVWALPPGPGRGAAMGLLLAAALTVAGGRRLARLGRGEPFEPLPPGVAVALAVGAQLLLRNRLLAEPVGMARTAVALVALPAVAGLAVAWLSRRYGAQRALVAGGVAAVLAPGFNVASTLGLVALAAADVFADPVRPRAARIGAAALLLLPVAWNPAAGALIAVAGLAARFPKAAVVPAAVAAAVVLGTAGGSADPLGSAAGLLLLVPAAVLPERSRGLPALLAVGLAAALPLDPNRGVLAAPVALAALSIRLPPAVPFELQRFWTAALALGVSLAAAYPWLRVDPLATALSWLGDLPLPALAGAAVAVVLILTTASRLRLPSPARAAPVFLFLALLLALPSPGTLLLGAGSAVVLDGARPAWEAELPPGSSGKPLERLVVDSALANGAGLPGGTPVAVVRLTDRAGGTAEWVLRVGEETGEWAARRPDVLAGAQHRPPEPWLCWRAGDFLGQRYRASWSPGASEPSRPPFTRVRIERAPGLPEEVTLALHRVEARG